jgi:pimeloyl-ACP methyl ester carboxylesterase
VLSVPTLVIHGGADYCNHPDGSAGKERFFSGRYERVVLEGIGHFPQREAGAAVQAEILRFIAAP